MRGGPLLILLVACEQPPSLQGSADELTFRSDGVVSTPAAERIVQEAASRPDAWAAPPYVVAPPAFFGKHVIGHHCVHLRDYETAHGEFRTVVAEDDLAMACAEVRRDVAMLTDWSGRFGVRWELRLGKRRAKVPGAAGEVARFTAVACDAAQLDDLAAIERRYSDRPK
jgi:hypothetical protein